MTTITLTLDEKRRALEMMGYVIRPSRHPGSMGNPQAELFDYAFLPGKGNIFVCEVEFFDPESNPAHADLAAERLRIAVVPSVRQCGPKTVEDCWLAFRPGDNGYCANPRRGKTRCEATAACVKAIVGAEMEKEDKAG